MIKIIVWWYLVVRMEEKLSALEALGVLKGLLAAEHWNVVHGKKTHSKRSQLHSVLHLTKSRKAVKSPQNEEVRSVKREWNQETQVKKREGKRGREEGLKSCDKMETNKSETDIPEEEKEALLTAEQDNDSKEKTDGCDYLIKYKETNSGNDTEVHNGVTPKEIPSSIQEWINLLPSKEKILREAGEGREESQGVSPVEDSPSIAAKLSREASLQSSSSLDSILDSRRPDPVEIFLSLGFGGVPGVNMENCRIPKRFLVPSKCKGGDWNEFLKRELLQAQNFECSSLGFRGLSGPSYRRPSAIVANIMEKLRERAIPHQPHTRSRFSAVAKRVLNEKSVLNKLTPEFQSVLSPDSRKFLQNQGKKSPEVPRRRIIFGQKSFAFAHDGEFIEIEPGSGDCDAGKDDPPASSDSEEPAPTFPSSEMLLKLRRPSLQKQKKVEEDCDPDDVFYIVANEERSAESESSYNPGKCSQKAGKIPRRFLSSTNLKALEENDLSEAMRLELEKEILSLSQRIKNMSNQDLPSALKQVKQLRSRLENTHESSEV